MKPRSDAAYAWGFALLGALFFLPFLGGAHLFDWDEVNFAEISREMLITREYTRVYVNFEPFFQKPPFFFWLQAGAMALFGVGEYAARFPNALCGILTLPLLFLAGKRLKGQRFGILWAGAYFGSVLPFLYFKSGIIDPWFNFFIFLGLYYFILAYWKKDGKEGITLSKNYWWYLFLGGFWIGMGILTKGPVAYLIAVLTMGVYWVYQRFRFYINVPQFLFFTASALLVSLIWFGLETMKNGPEFMIEFNVYQYRLFSTPDAGHRGFPGYHFVVLLVGCFPASVFAVRAFFRLPAERYDYQQDFRRWMKFLFWVVLILFTIVRSKIVHYSSMAYFPLTYLAALTIEGLVSGEIAWKRWMKILLYSIGGLFIVVLAALPFIGRHTELLIPLIDDPFAQGNLQAEVLWSGWEVIPGLWLLGLLIAFGWWMRRERKRAFALLFGGSAVFVMLTLIFLVNRIEGYSQRAAIDFFTRKRAEDAHYLVYGYKSYAHLFYGRPMEPGVACFKDEACRDALLAGPVDKPVYVVAKVHRAGPLREYPGLKEVETKNGFVFFRRDP